MSRESRQILRENISACSYEMQTHMDSGVMLGGSGGKSRTGSIEARRGDDRRGASARWILGMAGSAATVWERGPTTVVVELG